MVTAAKSKNNVFWIGLVLCTVYQSYRYPLQINTLGFSPNYSDTPFAWQVGKFVLCVPLMAVSAIQWIKSSARLKRWPIVVTVIFLSTYCAFKIVLGEPDSLYVDVSFWMLFALVLVLPIESVRISSIDRFLSLLLIYSLASDLMEVFLYVAFGRLPAMAGGFVRFGGFLDDPNGFAPLVLLLMGWAHQRYRGRTRFFVLANLFVALVLTQSWTGLAFFLVLLLVWTVVTASKRPLLAMFLICVVPWLVFVAVHWVLQLPLGPIYDILEAKQGSIEGHVFPWAKWTPRLYDWVFLGDWKYNSYENWWAAAMVNFGVVWLISYFGLMVSLLAYGWRSARATAELKPVYAGLLLFGCYFAAGSVGLPFPIKFPVNVLFFLFFFLIAFGKISVEDEERARHHRVPLTAKVNL